MRHTKNTIENVIQCAFLPSGGIELYATPGGGGKATKLLSEAGVVRRGFRGPKAHRRAA